MESVLSINDITVLVVEDEYLIADDLNRELVAHGITVIGPVATREAALAALATQRFDLAVLDINLRGDSVFPLADLLSARHIPFVFVTGYDLDAIPSRFAAVVRQEKPVRIHDLLATIERLAGSPEGRQELAAPGLDAGRIT